ncbi:hypothetical protein C1645_789733, partial [Glomus cerebriforme]
MIPDRRRYLCAIADNNDKIYLFGGEFTIQTSFNNWNVGKNGLFGRKGYTATFLP